MNDPTPQPATEHDAATEKMELALAHLLRAGVGLSLVLILTGLTISFFRHPHFLYDHTALAGITSRDSPFPHTVTQVFQDLPTAPGRSIMDIGLLVLLITPILRVAVSAAVFAARKDWRFALITSLVLAILLFSMLTGHTE